MPHFYRYRGDDESLRCKSRTPAPVMTSPRPSRTESAHVRCQGHEADLAVPVGDERNKVSLNALFQELDKTIKELKEDNAQLRAEVQQLRTKSSVQPAAAVAVAPTTTTASTDELEQRMESKLVSLGGQIEGVEKHVTRLEGQMGALGQDMSQCKNGQSETHRDVELVRSALEVLKNSQTTNEESSNLPDSESPEKTEQVTSVNNSTSVIFDVVRCEDWLGQDSFLPFSKANMNIGGGFHLDSGKFTAPVSGFYFFNVNVYGAPRDPVVLSIRANEFQEVASCSGVGKASQSCIVDLDEKDTVGVYVNEKSKIVDTSSNRYSHFIGFLLKPKM